MRMNMRACGRTAQSAKLIDRNRGRNRAILPGSGPEKSFALLTEIKRRSRNEVRALNASKHHQSVSSAFSCLKHEALEPEFMIQL